MDNITIKDGTIVVIPSIPVPPTEVSFNDVLKSVDDALQAVSLAQGTLTSAQNVVSNAQSDLDNANKVLTDARSLRDTAIAKGIDTTGALFPLNE